MDFTPEEKVELLITFQPLLKKIVRRACAFYNLNTAQVYDDLFQTATEGFLRHLKSIKSIHEVGGCWLDMYSYVVRDIRRMHVVTISRAMFNKKRHEYIQLPLEHAASVSDSVTEDEWVSDMIVKEFLDNRTPVERQAILMRSEEGGSNKEIMPVIGAKNEMGVSRFFKRMSDEYTKHIEDGEGAEK